MKNNGKLLIVDDEKSIRVLLKEVFEGEGYFVRTAPDAFEALDLIKTSDFDLVVTDIKMPGMSGVELVKESSKMNKDIIFLIITGYASLDTAQRAMKYGVYDYIQKPFDIPYIKIAVSRAFDRKRLFDENVRLKELSKLFALTESISSTLDRERLSKLLLDSAISYTDSDNGAMMVFRDNISDIDSNIVETITISGEFLDIISLGIENFSEKSHDLLCRVKKPVLITGDEFSGDILGRMVHIKNIDREWMVESSCQVMLIPVIRLNRLHGVLCLVKRNREQYTQKDIDFISIISNQGAITFDNANLISNLEQAYISMIESLILIVEAKDTYTYGHTKRVTELSVMIGKRMGLTYKELDALRLAASLHDIGKISVPETILNKPEVLDKEEWSYIKRHPSIADEVLTPLKFLGETREIIKSHHERYDGTGYPDGLAGQEIPFLTRIISVADAFDAMSSIRAYREPLSREEIRDQLEKNVGKQFDPGVVKIMIEMLDEETGAAL